MVVTTLYNGIVTYGPALALEQVAGIPILAGTLIVLGVCMFYTFLGGLKAVIYTNAFQFIIMVVGFLTIIIKAYFFDFADAEEGSVFEINSRGGRLVFDDFRVDPTIRHTFWSIVVAGIFSAWGPLYAVNQTQVQRYKSCQSMEGAQRALYINSVMISLIGVIIPGLGGLAMYAYFETCDPVSAEWVGDGDQLMAYLELNVLRN